ncbi:MAG: hypothetical protein K6E78_08310 [Treponema sp.]|nr:hypothetical protein [Treponema sp.]
MKKTVFLFLTALLAFSALTFGQEAGNDGESLTAPSTQEQVKKIENELSTNLNEPLGLDVFAGYGYLTSNTLVIGFTSIFGEIVSGTVKAIAESGKEEGEKETSKNDDSSFSDIGVFSIGANYHFNDTIYAGLSTTFQPFTLFDKSPLSVISFLANFGVEYGWKKAKFYNELGAGVVLYATPEETSPMFAMNLTLIGFKFNPVSNLWLFTDINLGQKGLINLGASWKF